PPWRRWRRPDPAPYPNRRVRGRGRRAPSSKTGALRPLSLAAYPRRSTSPSSSRRLRGGLAPPEQAFDVGELEFDVGGAAVVALAGVRRGFHLAEQGVHLGRGEPAARADRAMAGHGRADVLEPFLQR